MVPQANLSAIEGEDDHDSVNSKNRPPQIVMRMTSMGQNSNRNKIEPFLRPTSVNTVNAEVITIERDGYTQKRLLHRMKSSMNEKDNKKLLYRKRTMSGGAHGTASNSEKRKFKSQYTFSFGGDSAPSTARSRSMDRQDSRLYHKQDSRHVTFTDQDITHSHTHSSKATTLQVDTIAEESSEGVASPESIKATPIKFRRGTMASPPASPDICSTLGIVTSEGIKALPTYEWNTRFMRIASSPAKPAVDEKKLKDVEEPTGRRKSYSRTVAEKILKAGPLHLTLSKPQTAPESTTTTIPTSTSESKSYSRSTSMGPVKTPRAVARLQDTKWRSVGDNRWAQLTPKDSLPNTGNTGTREPPRSPQNTEAKNILTKFYNIIEAEPSSCRYVDGRKNHSLKSKYALKKIWEGDEDQLFHTPPKPQRVPFDRSKSPAEQDEEAELEDWKAYSLERAVETKFGEMKSLPVLASTGTHSMNWGKKVVSNSIA